MTKRSKFQSSAAPISVPKGAEYFQVTDPTVIIYPEGDRNIFRINIPEGRHAEFGIIVCDLVRHIAKALKVHEDKVWVWVDAERSNPTSDITEHS